MTVNVKRTVLVTALMCIFAALALTQTALADEQLTPDVKTYIISMNASSNALNRISQQPHRSMFWELPEIQAGQRREGGFTLSNTAPEEVEVRLEPVALPYDDEAALGYLMSLTLTVSDSGGTVLYSGPYAALNGNDGLKIEKALAPGENAEFRVVIQGSFAKGAEPVSLSDMGMWSFSARRTYAGERNLKGFFIAAGIIIAALTAVVGLILLLLRRSKARYAGKA